jgi:hypothetical protein
MNTLTPPALTFTFNPLIGRGFPAVEQVIADQPPRGPARRGGAVAHPPRPRAGHPPARAPRTSPPSAGSIERRAAGCHAAPALLRTGAGE